MSRLETLLTAIKEKFSVGKEGVNDLGFLTQIFADVRQSELPGYSGSQCTLESLSSILHWNLERFKGRRHASPKMVNDIMRTGNRLHSFLRDEYKLSDQPDDRIAMDDFPVDEFIRLFNVFGRPYVDVKLGGKEYVCTTSLRAFGDGLPSLKTFLDDAVSESAFIVTCGVLSHAIFKHESTYELFDSHGFITKYNGRYIKPKGSIFRFSSVDELNKFVLALHGKEAYIQVAAVTVRPPEVERLTKVFHEYRYEPYIDNTILPPGQYIPAILDDSSSTACEDSAYITMLGCRD